MPKVKEKPLSKSDLTAWEFTVEADTRRNGDILLQSIPGQRLRGAIEGNKPTIASVNQNVQEHEPTIPPHQSSGLSVLPKIPGQRISVNPSKGTYLITDPLRDDEKLCDRIVRGLKQKGFTGDKINGVADLEGTLQVDEMKTLCRELLQLVESGDAKAVDCTLPAMKEIDKLPGRYLLNPGSRTQNTQPRYEDQLDDWVQQLGSVGG